MCIAAAANLVGIIPNIYAKLRRAMAFSYSSTNITRNAFLVSPLETKRRGGATLFVIKVSANCGSCIVYLAMHYRNEVSWKF